MPDAVLVLNAGSSTVRFGLFEPSPQGVPILLCRGLLDEHDAEPRLTIKDADGEILSDRRRPHGEDEGELLNDILNWVDTFLASDALLAVGHRVVHGGRDFTAPVVLTDDIVQRLDALTLLAPLHQPRCLEPIRSLMAVRPELPQIACFDTAFHHGLADTVRRFAIPRHFDDLGIRRYGFHGLSYEFIARRLAEISPAQAGKRTVVAHLGSGASLCALRNGASVDTTMGLTPLDGLMMGTRSGAVDPGLPIYLQQQHGMSADEIEHMLYQKSGLLGVSGLSADMRALLASDHPRAAEAIDLFVFRASREVAAMANTLEGLECLVFTGGIGEHADAIRAKICARLRWLGVALDDDANAKAAERISSAASRVDVLVIPTSEETSIARHCLALLADAS